MRGVRSVVRKKSQTVPESTVVPDDIDEAIAVRNQTNTDLINLRRQAPAVQRMADALIDRQGKNHYIELLYRHIPGGTS